jgi:hypothetical protein
VLINLELSPLSLGNSPKGNGQRFPYYDECDSRILKIA